MKAMQVRIIKPGIFSTIQDMGRWHFLPQAVPLSGAMDTLSARVANKAVGNDDHAAVIEFTYSGAELLAETDLLIAWAGDGAEIRSENRLIPSQRPVFIPSGTWLRFTNSPAGSRTYLAISGGWDVPEVLGSRSTCLTTGIGGLNGRKLRKDDILTSSGSLTDVALKIRQTFNGTAVSYPPWSLARQLLLPRNKQTIRVVPAREFNWFDGRSVVDFLSAAYTLSRQSNRMGYHLEGPPVNQLKREEMLSTAVTPGTIQVTGSGSLILLTADCQTTGGYPRIAQIAAADMPLCGQLKPGDKIFFKEISRKEAERLYFEQEQLLRVLTVAVRSRLM